MVKVGDNKPVSASLTCEHLAEIPNGKVKTFLCEDVTEVLARLEFHAEASTLQYKLVFNTWHQLVEHESLVSDIMEVLASVALALWPAWYGKDDLFHASHRLTTEETLRKRLKSEISPSARQAICFPWLKSATHVCRQGAAPLFRNFPRAVQLAQLALSIDPDAPFFVLAVTDRNPQPFRLLGFARAAVWLAKETQAQVAVLLPNMFAEHRELDAILYEAMSVISPTRLKEDDPPFAEAKCLFGQFLGKPHPLSPGEQKLAKRLAEDAELSSLFRFNQHVGSVRESRYLVDMLWPEGQIIVEVDGYRYHGNRFGFSQDRLRDYELLISGYMTLRLPHDEVMSDIEIALEKIRDVVHFRQNQLEDKREV